MAKTVFDSIEENRKSILDSKNKLKSGQPDTGTIRKAIEHGKENIADLKERLDRVKKEKATRVLKFDEKIKMYEARIEKRKQELADAEELIKPKHTGRTAPGKKPTQKRKKVAKKKGAVKKGVSKKAVRKKKAKSKTKRIT